MRDKFSVSKFLLTLFTLCLLANTSLAQLVSQGNEQVVSYSGSTAFVISNTPVNPNLLVTTGTNTFIMSVNPPTNSARIYITNQTANACNNLTVSLASTGNTQLNSFNNSPQSWQTVNVAGGTGAFSASQPITLPANGTVAITSAPIIGSRIALFIPLSSTCTTTNIDLQVVFGTFTPANSSVQGLVATGANGSGVNPVIDGGLDNTNAVHPFGACSQSSGTNCVGGNGFGIAMGANGNTVSSVAGGTSISSANSAGNPLAVYPVARNGQSTTTMNGLVASQGGGPVSTTDNQSGLYTADVGFTHTSISNTVSSSPGALAVYGMGNLAQQEQGSQAFQSCVVQVHITNTSGTTPTLDAFFQTSYDGATWDDRIHFAQVTTTASDQISGINALVGFTPRAVTSLTIAASTERDGPIGPFGRFAFLVGGTAPVYSFSYGVTCK